MYEVKYYLSPNQEEIFLTTPPEDANFQFDIDKFLPVAQVLLQADENLSNARFYLVPKYIKEPQFWRNYFYRVFIIKEAYGLNKQSQPKAKDETSPAPTPSLTPISTSNPTSSSTTTTTKGNPELDETEEVKEVEETIPTLEQENEFISDDYNYHESVEVNAELNQFGVNNSPTRSKKASNSDSKKKADKWEDELKAELDEKMKAPTGDNVELDES